MSCSLIEAKFQALDRTIKMLSKSKNHRTPGVASSEQLRELVETKPTSLLPTIKLVKDLEVTRSNQPHSRTNRKSRSLPNTAREEKSEKKSEQWPPRPSTGRRYSRQSAAKVSTEKWVDPKQKRAEQLLQDTWNVPRSKLLNDNYRDENQEQDSNPYEERVQDELSSNQIHDDLDWFSPSAVETAPKTKRKNRPRTAIGKGSKDNKKSVEPPSPPRPEVEPTPKLVQVEVISEPDRKYPPAVPKADDPTFYMLELRLDHPEPLANWRFQASFTDTSVDPSKTVILDDLMADGENCLLFDDPRLPPGSTPSRFFNPFLYFPGLTRPSDLYGHVLRIIVTSLRPVTRTVINTSVQFTYSPDEAVVKPPVQSIRQRSENVATQDVRVLPQRNRSASSASRRGVKVSKVQQKKTPRLLQNNNHESSTSSLAMDQCNPWSSSEQNDTDADDHQAYTLGQMFTLYLDEPRPPSPTTPTRKDPIPENLTRSPQTPIATIDKKKMQLQSLRASMRREMSEHKIDNCNL
ncbi:hypothetical protein L917_05553 [Phytophthora nicotianae]|uniref:Uncharacterized protein n=1 Tax=Phytophthora nicotianae TaxID=4792 RepID=W2LKE3_PHYNI|nr:hypothetical protein L917_05553 [Phytophthora nicotianae]